MVRLIIPTTTMMIALSAACAARDSGPAAAPTTTSGVSTQAPTAPVSVDSSTPGSIPVGQEIDVRLRDRLSSETAAVEQRFEATTIVDLMQGGRVLVPAGSVVEGVVSSVDKAGRIDRDGSLTLSFDRLRVSGRTHEIRAMATQVFESRGILAEGGTAAVGAGVGGIVGGVIGGLKGAIIGAVIGAGGAIAATDGKDITLPAGAIIRIRMDSPVRVG
jgi:hypothetical protein